MRAGVIGLLIGVGLSVMVVGARLPRNEANAQRTSFRGNDLIPLSAVADDGHQQVTIIDSQDRVMSVYHVDKATGEISLRSVRNIRWDLQMNEFNSAKPPTREIRSLLGHR